MPSYPTTRQELFAAIDRRLTANQEALEQREPSQGHLKVFWLEVNPEFSPTPSTDDGWRNLGDALHAWLGEDYDEHVWLDTSGSRIWYAYTFGTRKQTKQLLNASLLNQRGVDYVWLAESFMERIRRRAGYESRGFRIFFHDALVPNRSDRPRFSAKFWVGPELDTGHQAFLDQASDLFSKTSIRMGRESENPDTQASGALIELYAQGSITVNASEDTEEVLGLIREIGESYASELKEMEARREKSPRPVEFVFKTEIKLDRFQRMVQAGQGKTKLWMQRYEVDEDLHRYSGVDLHTHQLVHLDVAPDYAYLVTEKDGCMNAAPRFMTVSAKRLAGRTDIFYEGDELFA